MWVGSTFLYNKTFLIIMCRVSAPPLRSILHVYKSCNCLFYLFKLDRIRRPWMGWD